MIKVPGGSLENNFLPSSRIGGSRVEESLGMNQKPNNGIGTKAGTQPGDTDLGDFRHCFWF